MTLSTLAWGVIGLVLTVMVLSYLIGDNVFFRIAAHVFVGLTAGYFAVIILYQIIWPYLISPLINGTWGERLWMIAPLVLILLLVISQFPKLIKLGTIPLAYLAGLTAALVIGGAVFGTLIPQSRAVVEAFDPNRLSPSANPSWRVIADAGVMLIGTVATLSYFHFGRKSQPADDLEKTERPKVFEVLSKVGQLFIGVTLGGIFAGIFSSAVLALIDRLIFMGGMISQLFGGG
jgi:hypothetical protein